MASQVIEPVILADHLPLKLPRLDEAQGRVWVLWPYRAQVYQVFPLQLLIISAAWDLRISCLELKASHKHIGVPIQTQGRAAGCTSLKELTLVGQADKRRKDMCLWIPLDLQTSYGTQMLSH